MILARDLGYRLEGTDSDALEVKKYEGPKMAKIAKKLTDTEIKSTKPADKEINLFDGDGLILRIAPL
ncbi:hypothetical protein MJN47_30070, partial [Salmonella enterica subsp. enterica serovar Lubbock]|nr:hypothetical protein [Salmonella enterica subsp. enterica serovar Lubbock]